MSYLRLIRIPLVFLPNLNAMSGDTALLAMLILVCKLMRKDCMVVRHDLHCM